MYNISSIGYHLYLKTKNCHVKGPLDMCPPKSKAKLVKILLDPCVPDRQNIARIIEFNVTKINRTLYIYICMYVHTGREGTHPHLLYRVLSFHHLCRGHTPTVELPNRKSTHPTSFRSSTVRGPGLNESENVST